MAVTTEIIKALRDKTGLSVMQCKKALEETDGDMEKALVVLRKQASVAAAKKADRTLGAGSIQAYIHAGGAVGALAELRSETDFVSQNPEFVALTRDIAMHVAASNPEYLKREDIPEAVIVQAREVFQKEAADKPDAVREKVVQGKLDAHFSQVVLLEQSFIKDGDRTIRDLIEAATQKFGEKIELTRFARFSVRS
jgi:elongation factor Ts